MNVALATDGSNGIAVGRGGTILTTVDAGASWTTRSSGTSERLYGIALAANGQVGIAVGGEGTILTTVDAGASWTTRSSGTDNSLYGIALAANGQVGIAVGGEGTILTTVDAGASWTTRSSGTDNSLYGVALATDGNNGLAVGREGIILATVDAGALWITRSSGTSNSLYGVALAKNERVSSAVGDRSRIVHSRALESPGSRTVETILEQIANNHPAITHLPSTYLYSFQDSKTRLDALEQEKERSLQQIRRLESGIQAVRETDDENVTAWQITTSVSSIRIGVLASVLFLVQILVSLSRYNTRLAAYYSARADALAILVPKSSFRDSIDMETMERLTQLLSPDSLDFGKNPRSVAAQAIDAAKSRLHRSTPSTH